MPDIQTTLFTWLVLLLAAIVYAWRAKHPDQKPLAAVLIFATVFSAVAIVLLFALAAGARLLGAETWLEQPTGIAVYLSLVFLPAFLIARWQLRRPPRPAPPID